MMIIIGSVLDMAYLSLWMVLEGPDLGHLLMAVEQWRPSSCAMHRHCLGWEGGYDRLY